jgi:dTDP-4-amino-4,6-dideoxygalactose transaminase
MKTPNSHKLFSKIVALSLMKNMDRDKMNEIISKINQIVKEEN